MSRATYDIDSEGMLVVTERKPAETVAHWNMATGCAGARTVGVVIVRAGKREWYVSRYWRDSIGERTYQCLDRGTSLRDAEIMHRDLVAATERMYSQLEECA